MEEEQLISQVNISLSIIPFINYPINSNCYLVKDCINKECIIIDPGSPNVSEVEVFIQNKELILRYIILTHEHFDHIWGLEGLRTLYNCKVVSSEICSNSITNPKKNLSVFHNQIGFSCREADIKIHKEIFKIKWGNNMIEFISTPGHTAGGICVSINNILFTGDTILNNNKTVTKLPGGDNNKLSISIKKIINRFDTNTMLYPGHGDPFFLSELKIENIL